MASAGLSICRLWHVPIDDRHDWNSLIEHSEKLFYLDSRMER